MQGVQKRTLAWMGCASSVAAKNWGGGWLCLASILYSLVVCPGKRVPCPNEELSTTTCTILARWVLCRTFATVYFLVECPGKTMPCPGEERMYTLCNAFVQLESSPPLCESYSVAQRKVLLKRCLELTEEGTLHWVPK